MMKTNRRNPFDVKYLLLVLPLLIALLSSIFADDESPRPPKSATFDYQEAMDDIRIDELQMHLGWMTDGLQEGRSSGTEGGHRAGDYLETELTLLGLEPAGTNESYLQGFQFIDGEPQYRNVLGIIRGGDPVLADEYIMICAHYDHVGIIDDELYPGANDNASGTSMILELAESLQKLEPRPKRSVIIAFWDAEEIGLLGSKHFADNPTVPLNKIKMVFNFDMVGTLQNNRFELFGSNVATGIREIVSRLIEPDDPEIEFSTEYLLASDHSSLYAKRIPAVMFFTGMGCPYHEPGDNFDIINFEGMKNIADIAFRIVFHLADSDELAKIKYLSPREVRRDHGKADQVLSVTDTTGDENTDDFDSIVRQGFTYRESRAEPGVLIVGTVISDRANESGLQTDDRIMHVNGERASGEALRNAVKTKHSLHCGGRHLSLEIERYGKISQLELAL